MSQTSSNEVCSVEGCEKSRNTTKSGWCGMHYMRWRRHGSLEEPVPPAREQRSCSVEGCDKPHNSHGLCVTHGQRLKKYGSLEPRKVTGENHHNYKEVPGYIGLHARVRVAKGKASENLCAASCGKKAAQWAYDRKDSEEVFDPTWRHPESPYSLKLEHYLPLCRSCHALLDFSCTEKRGRASTSADVVRSIKRRLEDPSSFESQKGLAEEFGVSACTISSIKKGRAWGWVQ